MSGNTDCVVRSTSPKRFWTVQATYLKDVESKIMAKRRVRTFFFCRHDPQPTNFELDFRFAWSVGCDGEEEEDWLSVFVSPTNRPVLITMMKFTLYDEQGRLLVERSDEEAAVATENKGFGWDEFYKFGEVEGEDVLWRFVCEIAYEEAPPPQGQPSPDDSCHSRLHDDLLKLLHNSEDADVEFLFKGERIPAHKSIIKARSSYFKRMFDSRMKESVSNEVEVEDAEPKVFIGLLQFLYSGQPPTKLREIDMELLSLADKYGVEELKKICEASVCANLKSDEVIDALLVADRHNCEDLMSQAQLIFRMHLHTLKQSKESWGRLKTNPDLLLKLLEYCYE